MKLEFANPTSVQIGMSGTFVGIHYRVAGRVVLGVEEAGDIYYWQEFNLVGDNGQSATLVYESSENGPEWKLFTLFEPEFPMSLQEAQVKRVGETVNLDGKPMRVTLVDESQVHYIECVAPEGVEVGDVAHYFNAELPNKMLVVSWTGNEIEFYHGMDVPRGTVPQAFGLLRDAPQDSLNLRAVELPSSHWPVKIIGVFLGAIILFVIYSTFKPRPAPAVPAKPKLAAAPFGMGGRGALGGVNYLLKNHAVVEIAQVSQLYDRHEYTLSTADDKTALLTFGFKPDLKQWFLFIPFEPANPMSSLQAGAVRAGDTVDLDGSPSQVTQLFLATLRQIQGVEATGSTNGSVFYGFSSNDKTKPLLVRWNESGIEFYRGKVLSAKEVTSAFAGKKGS